MLERASIAHCRSSLESAVTESMRVDPPVGTRATGVGCPDDTFFNERAGVWEQRAPASRQLRRAEFSAD
jgi:hypothetical protein